MTKRRGLIGAVVLTSVYLVLLGVASAIQAANTRAWGMEIEQYLASAHAAAMTAVFAVAMVAATLLFRRGLRTGAVLTAAGAAFGPMLLVAAPFNQRMVVDTSITAGPSLGTSTAWFVAVASILTVAIVAASALVLGRVPEASSDRRWLAAYLGVLVTLGVVVALFPSATSDGEGSTLLAVLVLSYVLLVTGVTVAGATAARTLPHLVLLEATVLVGAWTLYDAYHRDGGAPGVAGWEFGTSPTIATVATSTLLVLAPLVGAGGAQFAAWVAHRRPRTMTVEAAHSPA